MKKSITEIIIELTGETPVQYSGELKAIKCPFHEDKKPSLVIYNYSDSYFCYPCGFGGDKYNFYSRFKGTSYKAAKEALDGNIDTLVEVGEFLDSLHIVEDEVDYNSQLNLTLSKYCRNLLYEKPELENKIMEFLKKVDSHLTSGPINDILVKKLLKEAREIR